MHVLVILGLEQVLGLPGREVERDPASVVGVDDGLRSDARGEEPASDRLDAVLAGGEEVVDSFLSPVRAEVGG